MIRRITASFLAVLVAVVIVIIVPLGLVLSSRERHDFAASARVSAGAVATIMEERLGDPRNGGEPPLRRVRVTAGDGLVVLDGRGVPLLSEGRHVDKGLVATAVAGRQSHPDDLVVAIAPVGDPDHRDGTVVLIRDSGPLEHRLFVLWSGLAVAALLAMAAGAVVAAGLARWITRPLLDLQRTAVRVGHGDLAVGVDEDSGPPEVRALAATIAQMARRIGSLLHSHRVMTADVSHQLRTPLSALRLRLELLADEAPPSLQAELHDALRETARLSRLTNGLLRVARAEAQVARPEPIDVGAVVSERAEAWRALADDRDVSVAVQIDHAPHAWIGPDHLDQVLDNLIANSLDAVQSGGHLTLRVHPHGEYVRLQVCDDGPGMPESRREAAFSRYASDQTTPSTNGLGLAIVARLVATDRGNCRLEPTAGGGLTAVVDLPAEPSTSTRDQPVR